MKRRRDAFIVIALLAVATFGCGGIPSNSTDTVQSAIGPLFADEDEVVLSITDGKATVEYSINQLRELPSVSIEVYEPFELKRIRFVGVLIEDVLADSKMTDSKSITAIALNDYVNSTTRESLEESSAFIAYEEMLAVTTLIDYARGGPLRIIIPDNTPLSSQLSVWTWSLHRIEVAS